MKKIFRGPHAGATEVWSEASSWHQEVREFQEMRTLFFGRILNFSACLVLLVSVINGSRAIAATSGVVTAIEKIAVFPVLYKGERGDRIDDATAQSLDDTWWQVRDELTQTGRFVVASRAFLQQADAFQPRGALSVGDAVILGRYVEADALLTMSLKDRTLTVSVFNSTDGTNIWSQEVELHPSILVREQISKIARALIREFVAALPYQAVTVRDALSKQAVFLESGKRFARVTFGQAKAVAVGDPVNWIQVTRENLDPLFQGGSKIELRAEGVISQIRDQTAVVELTRTLDSEAVQAGTLVNLPKEQTRLTNSAKPKDSATSAAVVSLLANTAAIEPEAKQVERRQDDSGPVATTLSILGSLAVILLLAF